MPYRAENTASLVECSTSGRHTFQIVNIFEHRKEKYASALATTKTWTESHLEEALSGETSLVIGYKYLRPDIP